MDLKDETRNQHFISQVEQRLNSINPQANEDNQRIYSFSVIDREDHKIKIDSEKGCKISNNLSLMDIFSFDVLDKDQGRYNFEKLFSGYEAGIRSNTESLLSKLTTSGTDIKSEILNIFILKFINFVRNPYSVKKILNTFPVLNSVQPTDHIHLKNFQQVLQGTKPQQHYICSQLGITNEDYKNWLSVIFLLLAPLENNQYNFLERMVKSLYENPETFVMVIIYTYDEKTCLLSDRGYNNSLPEDKHLSMDFNLYSRGFIRYMFSDLESLIPGNTPKNLVDTYKSLPKSVSVHHIKNDLEALGQYNKYVVYQCFKKVFNSSKDCYGL